MSRPQRLSSAELGKAFYLKEQFDRLCEGQAPALRIVYDLTYPTLFGVALRILGDRCESEDIVQDSYIRIWTRAGSYNSSVNGNPLPWMSQIVRNGAIDHIRRRKCEQRAMDAFPLEMFDEAPSALLQIETKQEALLLAKMIEGLSLHAAAALHIAFTDDETYTAVSEQLGVPLSTIKSTIRRSLERIRPDVERMRSGEATETRREPVSAPTSVA